MKAIKWSQNYGICLGIGSLIVHFLLGWMSADLVEVIYFRGIFVAVKWILWPFSTLPVPALWIWIIGLFLLIGRLLYAVIKRSTSFWQGVRWVINGIGVLIFLFYLSWGFNYNLPSLQARLDWSKPTPDSAELIQLFELTSRRTLAAREQWQSTKHSPGTAAMLSDITKSQKDWLSQHGLLISVPAHIRSIQPGFLLRWSTAGFYFPMGGEGYWDGGLHELVKPFVMAHELAHNFGITDEGEANFVAFQTCRQSSHPLVVYSGYLSFWRYVAGNFRHLYPEKYEAYRDTFPDAFLEDLKDIRNQHEKYPDLFPRSRDWVYDSFLKIQGVRAGLASYSEVVALELAYQSQGNSD